MTRNQKDESARRDYLSYLLRVWRVEAKERTIWRDSLECPHTSWTLIAEGDLVVIHMPVEGTFTNQLVGIPSNGKKVSPWMCNVWKVIGGKAVEWWLNLDTLSLMQQLGVVPPLG